MPPEQRTASANDPRAARHPLTPRTCQFTLGPCHTGVAPFAYRPEEGELYVLLSLQSKTKGEMAALAKGGGRGRGKGRGGTAPGRGPGGKAKAGEGGSDATLKKELEEGGFALPGRLVYTFLGG